ncbi:MAG: hypothetical protein Q9M27_03510 [Mariprofundaceae bacterium]|nr:hypothetical protein [Mariprofundaceae bacterium]
MRQAVHAAGTAHCGIAEQTAQDLQTHVDELERFRKATIDRHP